MFVTSQLDGCIANYGRPAPAIRSRATSISVNERANCRDYIRISQNCEIGVGGRRDLHKVYWVQHIIVRGLTLENMQAVVFLPTAFRITRAKHRQAFQGLSPRVLSHDYHPSENFQWRQVSLL